MTVDTSAYAAVLANPDDDAARAAFAEAVGGARGEYISLALGRRLSKADKARLKTLLTEHRDAWAAPLGAIRTKQRWGRGFLVQALAGDHATAQTLAHPEWGLVEAIPGNMRLPPADHMEALQVLATFNTSNWLRTRARPWSRLTTLTARRAEVDLLFDEPERLPVVRTVELYCDDDVSDDEIVRLADRLDRFDFIGRASDATRLAVLLELLEETKLSTLVWAPDHAICGHATLTRGDDGRFRSFRVRRGAENVVVLAWLRALGPRRFDTIEVPGVDPGQWAESLRS
ncbi:MAG: hypothetical protein AAGF12_16460 [Myxococcota bacterium]